MFAIRDAQGSLRLSSQRVARFTAGQWLRRTAQRESGDWPIAEGSGDRTLRCDVLGCIYRANGHTAALVKDPRALKDDCGAATLIVSTVPVRPYCRSARIVIDRFDLWRSGGHAIWLNPDDKIEVRSVASLRGDPRLGR